MKFLLFFILLNLIFNSFAYSNYSSYSNNSNINYKTHSNTISNTHPHKKTSKSLSKYDSNYYIQAGKKYHINPQILWTIAYKESRLNPNAISKRNKNGTYDIGIMQINSVHLPRLYRKYRLNALDLLNPKINIFVGAEILKMCFDKHGLNENALTCYNGRIKNNPYGKEVLALLKEAIKTKGKIKNFKKVSHKKLFLLKFYPFKQLAKHHFSLFMRLEQGIKYIFIKKEKKK